MRNSPIETMRKSFANLTTTTNFKNIYRQFISVWTAATSRYPIGTNVYNLDWDALLILDTCRVDALREVAPEFDFIDNIDSMISVGSTSSEWIANTFREEYIDEINQTAHVTANSHAEHVLANRQYPDPQRRGRFDWTAHNMVEPEDFLILDQPWRYVEYNGIGHTPPEYITDRAVTAGRQQSPDRLVVHYSQPHDPYSAQAITEDRDQYHYEQRPFEALRNGVSRSKVWKAYLAELRRVLENIEVLLENLDAERVAISADHGEAFGEWGIYGHGLGFLHPNVKRVPWTITTATDTETYEPSVELQDTRNQTVEEQLNALGYR